ncbi:MAG: AbrB/MazE/SpoVT family DNA-binding domain-containing protein [Halobacteriales archaeon]|nr:AbrB/MazE/SpoVT family DNA-binding domain-containing protein [Halobacteriales archaeon]
MSKSERRTVGQRGQVTLPKELRERLGLHGGDEVLVYEEGGRIVIERPLTREEVAEGYRRRAERDRRIAREMEGTWHEADELLGDVLEW